jgi:hypothetical protein
MRVTSQQVLFMYATIAIEDRDPTQLHLHTLVVHVYKDKSSVRNFVRSIRTASAPTIAATSPLGAFGPSDSPAPPLGVGTFRRDGAGARGEYWVSNT